MKQEHAIRFCVWAKSKRASLTLVFIGITTPQVQRIIILCYLFHSNISTLIYCIKVQNIQWNCFVVVVLLSLFCSVLGDFGFLSRFQFKSSVSFLGVPRLEYGTNTSFNQWEEKCTEKNSPLCILIYSLIIFFHSHIHLISKSQWSPSIKMRSLIKIHGCSIQKPCISLLP